MPQGAGTGGNGAYRESTIATVKERAGQAARQAAAAAENARRYLASHNLQAIRRDVDHGLRTHPINTAVVAFAIGYLFGKLWKK